MKTLKSLRNFRLKKLTSFTQFLVFIGILVSFTHCSNRSRDLKNVFVDGLGNQLGISLFSLLDDYPALKNAMLKFTPSEFNARLNQSLQNQRQSVPGSLMGLQEILMDPDANLRETLEQLSNIIERIRSHSSYSQVLPLLERIRRSPGNLVPSLIPIQNRGLFHLYSTRTQEKLDESLKEIIQTLENPDNTELFKDIEDFIYDNLTRSEGLQSGIARLLEGIFSGENPRKGDFRSGLAFAIGGLGDAMGKLAGNDDGRKPAGQVLKEFIRNIRNFAIPGGAFYSVGAYNTPGHSAQFQIYLEDLYKAVRRLILTPSNLVKNPNHPIFIGLAENYFALGFTGSLNDVDISLAQLGEVDLRGKRRSTVVGSDPISAIEHLFFALSLIDKFGYYWQNDPSRPQIISSSNGILTIGDALHSLSSKLITAGVFVRQGNLVQSNNTITLTGAPPPTSGIKIGFLVIANGVKQGSSVQSITPDTNTVTITCSSPPCVTNTQDDVILTFVDGDPNSTNSSVANLGVGAILWLSSISDYVRKDGNIFTFNLNTPALALLEGESRGPISGTNDPVYSRTIPWALGLITDVLLSGKGPYFNKNRKDEAGNILTLDGKVYRNASGQDLIYKKTWNTSKYAIPALKSDNPTLNRWVGLGGFSGGDGTNNNLYEGSSYTIHEIDIPDAERAVESDEVAFYKNFQWLLYQKRMVIVIPVAIDALGGELREAAYVTIIGNGLKGLMEVKPFCRNTGCVDLDIGKWLKSQQDIKPNFKTPQTNLVTFSNIPGDSVFLLEVWGFGLSGNFFGFTDNTVLNQVYTLLFPKKNAPQDFYGPIPPAIRWNFEAIERLGFTNSVLVTPDKVEENWNRRNRLLPLIVALAKTFKDQTDNSINNTRNPYFILSELADVLSRPYRLDGNDPTAAGDPNDNATVVDTNIQIPLYRIRGFSGVFGIRSPSMPDPQLYYPDSNLRSPFSILLENNRRQNDGLINLLGKGNFLTGLGLFLYELGRPENHDARIKIHVGLQNILNEIRPASEIHSSTQINLSSILIDLVDFIKDEVDPPNARLSDANYLNRNIYDRFAEFAYDFLSKESPFGYSENIEGILHSIAYARPTYSELRHFILLVAGIFVDSNGNKDYFLTDLLQNDIPKALRPIMGRSRDLIGLLEGMTREGEFLGWFWQKGVSDYPADAVLHDLQRFFRSPIIQTNDRSRDDFLYNLAELLGRFGRMANQPRVPGSMPHWFPDHWNSQEPVDTVFDRLNFILSKK